MQCHIFLLLITARKIFTNNICGHYYQDRIISKTKCGLWNAFRCTVYKSILRNREDCCQGYINYPICNAFYPISTFTVVSLEESQGLTDTSLDSPSTSSSGNSDEASEVTQEALNSKTVLGIVIGILVLIAIVLLTMFIRQRRYKKTVSDMGSRIAETNNVDNQDEVPEGSEQVHLDAELTLSATYIKTKNIGENSKHQNKSLTLADDSYNHIDWNSTKDNDPYHEDSKCSTGFSNNMNSNPDSQTGNCNILDRQMTRLDRTTVADDYELALPISNRNDDDALRFVGVKNKNMLLKNETKNSLSRSDQRG